MVGGGKGGNRLVQAIAWSSPHVGLADAWARPRLPGGVYVTLASSGRRFCTGGLEEPVRQTLH